MPHEEEELIKLLLFLEDTYTTRNKSSIDNEKIELSLTSTNILSYIKIIIKGLSITHVKNFDISLELHKSLLIYLKNILIMHQRYINDSDIFKCIYDIFNLMLSANTESAQCESMIILFENLIKTVCENNTMMKNNNYKETLFKLILDKVSSANEYDFLFISKNGLLLINSLIFSNSYNQDNYLDFVRKYFIPLIDNIFQKVHLFIVPDKNILENNFISILTELYKIFYEILLKMKKFYSSLNRKDIADEILIKYGRYTYELIQINPNIDEETINKFGDPNPIIIFDDNYTEINFMKASAFRFLILGIRYSKMSSNDDGNNKNILFEEKKNNITNNEIINIISKVISLVIKSYENILNNEKKFYFLKEIDDETGDEENSFNNLEFDQHMKLFLLNVLFPLLITVESELKYMRSDPEEYCAYFNDLLYNFTLHNFNISGLFLIKKICEYYEDLPNFIFSYIIGMMDDIINKDQNNINNIYNIYNFYKSQNVLFDKLSENIKLDFCILVLIVLQEKLLNYDNLKNKLKEVLIKAQDKFIKIRDPLIKMKFCHLFKFIIPNIFSENENQKEDENFNNDNNNETGNIINIENDIESNDINNIFVQKALYFLFENLTQSNSEDYSEQSLYYHSLGNEASEIIIYLTKFVKEKDNKNISLKNTLVNSFQNYFNDLIDIINITELYSLFNVIEQIIKDIKINDREKLFNCLEKLTSRFERENDEGDYNSQIYCPLYFSIISSFFNGVNRIDRTNNNFQTELKKFDDIFKPALNFMKDIHKFLYYENLVKAMVDYVKNLQGINESSKIVFISMFRIIDNERTFSLSSYSFVCNFLYYLENNISEKDIGQDSLFKTIIKLINICFEIDCDQHDFSNLYALLLTFQIYSKNMDIIDNFAKNLLNKTLKCFAYIFENDKKNDTEKEKKERDEYYL